MSLVKQFNNKYLILIGIKLCQFIPKKMALTLIEPLSSVIAGLKKSDLIMAVKSNQKVISQDESLTAADLDKRTRAVIKHALTCYYDFFRTIDDSEKMSSLFPTADELNKKFDQATREEGALVIAPHLSNFNLLFQVITEKGFRAKLLTLSNLYSGYGVINKIRSRVGAEIVPIDEDSYFIEVVEHLKSGGMAITAVDRPVPTRKSNHRLSFFGKPSALPVGYISLALAADIPIIIVTTFMTKRGLYKFKFSEKIRLQKYQNKLDDLILNGEMVLKKIELLIKEAPEQWLMYYPVWPDLMNWEL
jgi:phosphatidylinositol dimannoside acyltransferase